jgi:hypothetical protein
MNYRILLTNLTLWKVKGHYRLRLQAGPHIAESLTDNNLGTITSLLSHNLKQLTASICRLPKPVLEAKDITPSNIDLDTYEISELTILPYRWRLYMHWTDPKTRKGYPFTANMDSDLESMVSSYSAAMRFYGIKSGLLVMDEEFDIRNVDRAAEDGYRWINQPDPETQGGVA